MKNKREKKQTNMFLIDKKKRKEKNLCYLLVGDQSQSADWHANWEFFKKIFKSHLHPSLS